MALMHTARISRFGMLTASVSILVLLSGCRGGNVKPAPAPTVVLIKATPAPPEEVAQVAPQPLPPPSQVRATFVTEYKDYVPFATSSPLGGASVGSSVSPSSLSSGAAPTIAPSANATGTPSGNATSSSSPATSTAATMSPSLALSTAATSFREVSAAMHEEKKGLPITAPATVLSVKDPSKQRLLFLHSKSLPAPAGTPLRVYAGRGFFMGASNAIKAAYANQSVNPALRFDADSGSYLYAPTMLAPDGACIEVVTAYSSGPAQVWFWDWCNAMVNNPAVPLIVNAEFISQYVRDFGSGIGEYTVQTTHLPGGNIWVAKLYNYQSGRWDEKYRSSGQTLTTMGNTGWDFFEEHAVKDGTWSDYCNLLPAFFESTDLEITHNGTSFINLSGNDGQPLNQGDLTCNRLHYGVSAQLYHWTMITK